MILSLCIGQLRDIILKPSSECLNNEHFVEKDKKGNKKEKKGHAVSEIKSFSIVSVGILNKHFHFSHTRLKTSVQLYL